MTFPNRIGKLMSRIEAGETITQQDWDRLALLQTLDVAQFGEEFVQDFIASQDQQRKILEGITS